MGSPIGECSLFFMFMMLADWFYPGSKEIVKKEWSTSKRALLCIHIRRVI
jgi:hypothetical protein